MLGHHCTYISSIPFYRFLLNILRNTRILWSPGLGQGWGMGKAEAVSNFKRGEVQSDIKVSEITFTELGKSHITKRYSRLNMRRAGKGCLSALFWPFHKNILHRLYKSKYVKNLVVVKGRSGQPWGCTVPAGPEPQSQGCVLVVW